MYGILDEKSRVVYYAPHEELKNLREHLQKQGISGTTVVMLRVHPHQENPLEPEQTFYAIVSKQGLKDYYNLTDEAVEALWQPLRKNKAGTLAVYEAKGKMSDYEAQPQNVKDVLYPRLPMEGKITIYEYFEQNATDWVDDV